MLFQVEKLQLMHKHTYIYFVLNIHTRNVIKSKAIFSTELECIEEQSNINMAHQLGKYEIS